MIVIEAKVSWSMVYYSSDFLAIWIWHLQNSKMSKSTLFLVQNCEGCLVSCITWWYMIPNARRKFEAFLKFPEGFGHWGRSILVNGILYFRLFGHLEMTSSKYQNVKINFDSGSNLRRALGNMYHHVIHDSKRSAQVWWLMEDFPGVLSHPGRHTGPRKKKHFFLFKNRENTYSSENKFQATFMAVVLFPKNSVCLQITFWWFSGKPPKGLFINDVITRGGGGG